MTDGQPSTAIDSDSAGAAQVGDAADTGRTMQWLLRAAASVGSVALLSTLLFYFGWVHTAAQAKYFGFDSTLYDLSSTEYTLRSVSTALPSLAVATLVMLGLTVIYDRIDSRLVEPVRRRRTSSAAVVVGVLSVVFGVGLLSGDQSTNATPAILLLAGSALLAGGALLSDTRRRLLLVAVAALLAVAGAFQAVRAFASTTGRARAEESALEMDSTALLRVFSAEELQLTKVGSLRASVSVDDDGGKTYVYDCLHLLDRIGARYFLVPHGYSRQANRRIVYIVDVEAVRIDVDARYLERREAPPC